jgi:hypothetical protein
VWRSPPRPNVCRECVESQRGVGVLRSRCSLAGSGDRSKVPLEARQMLRNRPPRCTFHGSVVMDDFCAELSERRGPAALTTERRIDDRFPEQRIHAVNEQPCGPIRHFHPARGFADRSAIADRFQDLDFSRPKGTIGGEVEAKQHACHVPMLRPPRGLSEYRDWGESGAVSDTGRTRRCGSRFTIWKLRLLTGERFVMLRPDKATVRPSPAFTDDSALRASEAPAESRAAGGFRKYD